MNNLKELLDIDASSASTGELIQALEILRIFEVVLHNRQLAIKIDINSLYGILGNKWSRYCDYDIAAAITSTSASTIKYIGGYVNKEFANAGFKEVLVYIDTDSIFLSLEEIVDLYFGAKKPDGYSEIRQFIDDFFNSTIQPMIDNAIRDCMAVYSCDDIHNQYNYLTMSREVIGSSGFWKAKKKYVISVNDNEGFVYDEPKLKIKGLEIISRTSSQFAKDNMPKTLDFILSGNEDGLVSYNKEMKRKFVTEDPGDVSSIKPANNLKKYILPNQQFLTGTPSHAKAALRYNQMIEKFGLSSKYNEIKEGDTIHFIYLKEPNPTKLKYFAWPLGGTIPPELNIDRFIDWKVQFEKVYVNRVRDYTDILGWRYSDKRKLMSLLRKKEQESYPADKTHTIFDSMRNYKAHSLGEKNE
jgi:DNA polymerase elongation subunit (family B)